MEVLYCDNRSAESGYEVVEFPELTLIAVV